MAHYPTAFVAGNQLNAADLNASFLDVSPIGVVKMFAGIVAPSSHSFCDGSAISRSTYASLFGILCPTLGTFTVTIATPAVVTLTAHGRATGDAVFLTTTGALPTGLSANTQYWIIKTGTDTFNLASSLANALAGTKINTSGSQSGVHTAKLCPYGVGDGSTTFNLPDFRGLFPVGVKQTDTNFAGLNQSGGESTHVLTTAEMPSHTHTIAPGDTSGTSGTTRAWDKTTTGSGTNAIATGSNGSDTAHNNLPPYFAINFIIRTL